VFVIISINQQVKSLKYISNLSKSFFLLFLLFLLFGCKTTNGLSRKEFTPEAPYHLEENVAFNDFEEEYSYIFIRLYNPSYSNPFYYANTLKNLIAVTEVTNYKASHASIGFSLEDTFYGLSSPGNGTLKVEHCTNPKSNIYMKRCNPKKSDQLTLAIKVRQSEYNNIKDFVLKNVENPNLSYDIGNNIPIGSISIKRKFFSDKEHKKFGNVKYPKTDFTYEDETEEKFVCCTFIAYTLIKYIPEFRDWFEEHQVDYRKLTVTDLIYLPYTNKLFYSSWENYNLAAEAFAANNTDFTSYLNN